MLVSAGHIVGHGCQRPVYVDDHHFLINLRLCRSRTSQWYGRVHLEPHRSAGGVGPYRGGNGGVVIGLEAVSELFNGIEESLEAGDWDALIGTQPTEPDVMPEDEMELCRLIEEADRMQRLISSYLDQVHSDLDEAPQLRRAATAYTRAETA